MNSTTPSALWETNYLKLETQLHDLSQVVTATTSTDLSLHHDANREEQAALDALVGRFDASYTDNISTLKYRRNQFATVNRLPNEILSRIFLLCVDEFERHWYSEWYVWQYLRLTSVCRRWRHLAIDVVQLWTLIDLNCREDLIQMHLSRSKNAKLTVVHSRLKPFLEIGVDVEISLFKELLVPQLHRIVALQLRVSPRLWAEVHPCLQLPAPSLRHLSLTRCHDCALPDEGPESEVLNSQNLFLGQAQLETLDLRYRTQWSSLLPLVSGLRALRLSVGRDSHGALQELIAALHFIPTLEYLELQLHDHVYQLNPPPYISATHSLSVVTLPHLVELVIHSTNDAYILDYLITPRLRQCFIKISLLPHPARFLIPLTRCFSFAEVQDMRVVPVAYGPQFCFTEPNTEPARPYADMSQGADFVSTPFQLHPGIQLVIAWLAPSDPGMEFMYTSLMGRAGKLRRLVLQGNIGRRHLFHILKLHVQVLRRASNIRDLVIESHRDILDILELLEDTNVCPQLTTFSCVGCASDRKSFGKQLVAFARARRRSNVLTHIRMSNCPPVANMWIAQLNRLGVELTETDVGQPRRIEELQRELAIRRQHNHSDYDETLPATQHEVTNPARGTIDLPCVKDAINGFVVSITDWHSSTSRAPPYDSGVFWDTCMVLRSERNF